MQNRLNQINHNGTSVPAVVYGTAWKEERTESLVNMAINSGFRGIDTANQRKHYFEAGVGNALKNLFDTSMFSRDELYIQTKFTYLRGQDHRLPYDEHASVTDQVLQSFVSSLDHLGVKQLDCYVLHGPETSSSTLTENDKAVWRTMESLQLAGKTKHIGASNMTSGQIESLCKWAKIKPFLVQNRCYPSIDWDRKARDVCKEFSVLYQGFSLIRDPLVWQSPAIAKMCTAYCKTPAQIIYRFGIQVGMQVLCGSTSEKHQLEALDIFNFELSPEDIRAIEGLK